MTLGHPERAVARGGASPVRVLCAVLLAGPIIALALAVLAGGTARQIEVLGACAGGSALMAGVLLVGGRRWSTVPVLTGVMAGYVVVLCVVAVALGRVLGGPPFYSYLSWALPIAFVVLPPVRALWVSGWTLLCAIVMTILTRGADSWRNPCVSG